MKASVVLRDANLPVVLRLLTGKEAGYFCFWFRSKRKCLRHAMLVLVEYGVFRGVER
jgi:hypothetical protein